MCSAVLLATSLLTAYACAAAIIAIRWKILWLPQDVRMRLWCVHTSRCLFFFFITSSSSHYDCQEHLVCCWCAVCSSAQIISMRPYVLARVVCWTSLWSRACSHRRFCTFLKAWQSHLMSGDRSCEYIYLVRCLFFLLTFSARLQALKNHSFQKTWRGNMCLGCFLLKTLNASRISFIRRQPPELHVMSDFFNNSNRRCLMCCSGPFAGSCLSLHFQR